MWLFFSGMMSDNKCPESSVVAHRKAMYKVTSAPWRDAYREVRNGCLVEILQLRLWFDWIFVKINSWVEYFWHPISSSLHICHHSWEFQLFVFCQSDLHTASSKHMLLLFSKHLAKESFQRLKKCIYLRLIWYAINP